MSGKPGFVMGGVLLVGGLVVNGWAWLRTQKWAPEWVKRNRKGEA